MDSSALIELVKLYPVIYSRQSASGSTIEQKNAIWKEIAAKLQQPPDKCKAKWRNLRDSYQKSMKYRRELESIGKEDIYHEYRHESALSFLEVGTKRKSSDGEKRLKPIKKQRDETYFESYSEAHEMSPSHNVEYIIESEQDNTDCRVDEDDEEQSMMYQTTSAEEDHLQEISTDQIENNPGEIKNEGKIEPSFSLYESRLDNENESTPHEVLAYQEAFVNESATAVSSGLDSWLSSLKQTLLSFPKLIQARAKKNINDIVSELEINYLESIEHEKTNNN